MTRRVDKDTFWDFIGKAADLLAVSGLIGAAVVWVMAHLLDLDITETFPPASFLGPDAASAVLGALLGILAAVVASVRLPPRIAPPDEFPYEPLEPKELWNHLPALASGIRQHLPRPEVEAAIAGALEADGRPPDGLLLYGPQGSGKTREAYEYAQVRAASLTGKVCCFVIRNPSLEVPFGLPPFEMNAAILVFDDLHRYWDARGDETIPGASTGERVAEIIAYFKKHTGGNCTAIATVRQEWWEGIKGDKHIAEALRLFRHHVHLPLADGTSLERDYLCVVAKSHDLEVSNDVLDDLADAGDGSFQAPADFFRDLDRRKASDDRVVSEQDAAQLQDYCSDNWRQRVLNARPEAEQTAVELMSILSACRVPLRRVYLHALHRERSCTTRVARSLYRWRQGRRLRSALKAIAHDLFPEQAGEFRPHGSRLDDADRSNVLEEAMQVGRALRTRVIRRQRRLELVDGLQEVASVLFSHAANAALLDEVTESELLRCLEAASGIVSWHNQFRRWAINENLMALYWVHVAHGDRERNLQRAANHLMTSLQIFTMKDFHDEWAVTQFYLARVNLELFRFEPRGKHLASAETHARNAMLAPSPDGLPNFSAMGARLLTEIQAIRREIEESEGGDEA